MCIYNCTTTHTHTHIHMYEIYICVYMMHMVNFPAMFDMTKKTTPGIAPGLRVKAPEMLPGHKTPLEGARHCWDSGKMAIEIVSFPSKNGEC